MKKIAFLTTDLLGNRAFSINSHLLLMLYVLRDILRDMYVYILSSNINSEPVFSFSQVREQHSIPVPSFDMEVMVVDYRSVDEAARILSSCDTVFSEMYIWAPAILEAKKMNPNIKVFYWIHSLLAEEMICNRHSKWIDYNLFEKMQKDLITIADKIVLDSHYDCDLCDRFYNSQAKSSIIYPVPLPYLSRCKPHYKEKTIFYTGRWEYRKGMEYLIRAFFKLYSEDPSVKLTMLSDMNYIDNFESVFYDNTVTHMFKWLMEKGVINLAPWINKRTEYIDFVKREATVVVLPSLYDPFNIIAYDCAVNSIPMVLSNFCGVTEIINDFSKIERINPFDSTQIYHSMKKFIESSYDTEDSDINKCSYNINDFQRDLIKVFK